MKISSGIFIKTIISVLSLCVIGTVDWLSGPDVFFSLFYLVPLIWLAYDKQITLTLLIINSGFAGLVWFLTEAFLIHENNTIPLLYWNGLIRLANFVSIPFLIYFIQKKHKKLLFLSDEIIKDKINIEKQNSVIAEKNANLRKIKDELEMLAHVISKTEVGVVIMKGDTSVEWVNEGFEKKYNLKLEDLKNIYGNKFSGLVANNTYKDSIQKCVTQKNTIVFESEIQNENENIQFFQTALTPILNSDGDIDKLIAIDTDITKLKTIEKNLIEQHDLVHSKNQNITDSLYYAQGIQQIILPSFTTLNNYFEDILIFYKPKDIVSGDFYWFYETGNLAFLAAIDCTGHGVPGALMSMIGNTLLNEIIILNKIYSPSEILQELNKRVTSTFSMQGTNNLSNGDGMDISLCCLDKENKTMKVACAGHTIITIKNNKMEIVESGLFSIGSIFKKQLDTSFPETIIEMDDKINVYLYSDGFQDQFGGEEDTKYMSQRFHDFIYSIHKKPFKEQFNDLHSEFTSWKGDGKQTDDILILGFTV